MDYLAKRIIEKLKARGDAEQQRAEEWQRSLKPTIYRGNNLFQELGGEPIEGRYLGQVGLVPGQSVPNIARNPNKLVIPGLPLPPAEAIEDEVFIPKSTPNGIYVIGEGNWLINFDTPYNRALIKDFFSGELNVYLWETEVMPDFQVLKNVLQEESRQLEIVPPGTIHEKKFETIFVQTIIPEFFIPGQEFPQYTAEQILAIKNYAKRGKVILYLPESVPVEYFNVQNGRLLNLLGLDKFINIRGYLTERGFDVVTTPITFPWLVNFYKNPGNISGPSGLVFDITLKVIGIAREAGTTSGFTFVYVSPQLI